MEEDLDRTIQKELDWGVQQLQTGLFQLKLSPQQVEEIRETLQCRNVPTMQKRQLMNHVFGDYQSQIAKEWETLQEEALNSTPAASQQHNSIDCVLGAHGECSRSCGQSQCNFQFSFVVPEGMSDDPVETHPACGHLNSNPSDSSKQQQAGSSDIVTAASHQGAEEERLKVFTEAESQESDFKFNFANSKTDAEVQQGDCTGRPVPIVQSMETKADPVLQSHQKAKQVRHSENTASKPSKKKKMRSSKRVAEPVRGGERQSGESDGKERNSAAHGVGRCLSSDEQLRREVDWCIEQLELGLRTQKPSQKQADGALQALKTLRSEKAPLVKKRQVMRSIFGDYRKKMEEEWQKQFRLMLAATKSSNIKPAGRQTRSKIFRKCANKLRSGEGSPKSGSINPERNTVACVSECDRDQQSHFRFNFF